MALRCNKGFNLVEVVLAMAIATFAIITTLALMPVGIKANQESIQETLGTSVLRSLGTDIQLSYRSQTSGQYGFVWEGWNGDAILTHFDSAGSKIESGNLDNAAFCSRIRLLNPETVHVIVWWPGHQPLSNAEQWVESSIGLPPEVVP